MWKYGERLRISSVPRYEQNTEGGVNSLADMCVDVVVTIIIIVVVASVE
jgi:hypothetical protein